MPSGIGFAPAQLVLPELSILRRGERAWLTLTGVVNPAEQADALHERLLTRMGELEPATMPLIDPSPTRPARIAGAAPPASHAVGTAT